MSSRAWSDRTRQALPYAVGVTALAATTAVLLPFRDRLNTLNVALLYLIAVTLISLRATLWASIATSVFAFLCFDYFFIPPYLTLTVARADHVLALFVFLGIAILVTQLVVRGRQRTAEALRRGRQTATLYELSTALIGAAGLNATLDAIAERVRQVFGLDTCAILLDERGELCPRAVAGAPLDFTDRTLLGLARTVLDQRQPAGLGTERARLRLPTPPGRPRPAIEPGDRRRGLLLLPIATAAQPLGVLIVARQPGRSRFDPEEEQLLGTFANHAALAIERSLLTEERTRAEVLARSDHLKSVLLSAVSHDLRTPLASIKASVTAMLQADVAWTEADRRDLLAAIDEEADRLNQLVTNLLDLSRIEGGALQLDLHWYDLSEIVHAALDRTEAAVHAHPVTLHLPDDLPPLRLDFVKIVQVLVNLIENAAHYSPAGSPIAITVRRREHAVEISVRDQGIGIPRGEEERIFQAFYRVEAPDRQLGSGVGLAICRGFIEAHGGRIWAERNADRGTTIRFTLPLGREVPRAAERPESKVGAP
ncbi:MAG: ATP-binding protein [Sphaerobacter sp.]|nr:ATP-binding protein [Sphaerobacter sp.]